jgi:hypothetical protein
LVDHVREAERQMRRGLPRRRVHEPKLASVADQSDRDARVTEQSLELRGGRVTPWAGLFLVLVEAQAEPGGSGIVAHVPHQSSPRRCRVCLRRPLRRFVRLERREWIVVIRVERAARDGEARANVLSPFLGVEV